ncbi:MAG: aminopeptidase P family protein [Candidatus Marinimicrobia bacterium]|nr:aminopeptidase P family protein [Candidatus Neomarinimicrobiota bacterium]MBL7011047.1 aminopeptidase P family protein [Candidatus Neomarinimicrobiota bacterium]MBL7031400.1 aminopeptidase P family protein [Candidatus Neomarinimicrobiota bacterium]
MKRISFILSFIMSVVQADDLKDDILSMHQRAVVRDGFLKDRFETVLPEIMARNNMDMWIVIAREYNEDPVIRTMLPATWLNARRRTILVIYNSGNGQPLESYAVARYDVGEIFKKAWDPEAQPNQYKALADLIQSKNPKSIGINRSAYFAQADGITANEFELLKKALPKKYLRRLVNAEKVAIGWLETRSAKEMEVYPEICRIAHDIIKEGFSAQVIRPGITTTDDVVWWYRDRIRELNLITWFHPTVDIQRADRQDFNFLEAFSKDKADNVIRPGDLLHVDFGITYLGLNTDTQQHAYVLMPGESRTPNFLVKALGVGNRLQDILTDQFKTGRTGNEMLLSALKQAKEEGIKPQIYTHPIGYYGHGSGPTIGMWDKQEGVPVNGDYPLFPNTAYSIELNAKVHIKEWDKEVAIMLEEDALFDGKTCDYIDPRQTEMIIIDWETDK